VSGDIGQIDQPVGPIGVKFTALECFAVSKDDPTGVGFNSDNEFSCAQSHSQPFALADGESLNPFMPTENRPVGGDQLTRSVLGPLGDLSLLILDTLLLSDILLLSVVETITHELVVAALGDKANFLALFFLSDL
jgi:hypothetical protein